MSTQNTEIAYSSLKHGCVEDCPACPHRRFSKEQSLAQKQNWLHKRLAEFSAIIEPVRSLDEQHRWNYRQKVCLAAGYNVTSWNFGIWRRQTIIPIHHCPVQHHLVNQNLQLFSKILPPPEKFPLSWYLQSGAQVTMVLKCRQLPALDWLDEATILQLQKNGVEGLWLHLFPSTGKKVTGKGGWYLVAGKPRSLNADGFCYGPSSFQQVLPGLYNNSLNQACEFLEPDSNTAVIDLYCGIGASLKQWINAGAEVIGAELGEEALQCAAVNAPQATLLRGTCAQRIPQLHEFAEKSRVSDKKLLVYANPPRTGLEREVSDWITKDLRPEKIAYLSCSAGTLNRDLIILKENGFEPERLIPYDFFPHTLHVEVLALIGKK